MVAAKATTGYCLGQPVKSVKTVVLHFDQDGKKTDGGNTVSGDIQNNPFLGQCIQGEQGKQHEPDLRYAGISQHSFYTLLEYSRNISDKECDRRDDGNIISAIEV